MTETDQDQKTVAIQTIYVKDVSFEAPNSPGVFMEENIQPETKINLSNTHNKIAENSYDVSLTIKAEASYGDHQSSRTQRVVRSTLAGEAIAADNAVDRGTFYATHLQEIITGIPAFAEKLKIPVYLVTDCKSLYDSIISEAPN